MHLAIEHGNLELCEFVIRQFDDFIKLNITDHEGQTPFFVAAKYGHLSICKLIVDNYPCPVCHEAPTGDNGQTPLHQAIELGHLELCEFIIHHFVEKNSCCILEETDYGGNTPLHLAATCGHLEICRLIVQNVEYKSTKNSKGKTPLQLAVSGGHVSVKDLIESALAKALAKRKKRKRKMLTWTTASKRYRARSL